MVALSRHDEVCVIDLGDGENRFTPAWIAELSGLLDELSGVEGPCAVLTVARGKFWSNGLDLDWLIEHRDQAGPYVASVQELYVKFLELPAYSIAVLQGHCFAAGALLALSMDARAMRVDRGFFCLPEIDLGIPFSTGMTSLVQDKLSADAAVESMLTAKRYGGAEALQAGIVESVHAEDELFDAALAKAEALASKAGPTMRAIRSQMYRGTIERLSADATLKLP
jgi:enoyl-CoA hydratase/carnithine racemase